MQSTRRETPCYICPNDCEEPIFFKDGHLKVTRFFDRDGQPREDETYDFVPTCKMKCRCCGVVAIEKKKIVTITVVVE